MTFYHDMFIRTTQDPDAAPVLASNAASRELMGLPLQTTQEVSDRIRAMHPQAVADAVAELRDTFCWLLPHGTEVDDRRLAPIGGDPSMRLKKMTQEYQLGKEQRQGLDDPKRKVSLVLADDGLMIDYNSNHAMPGGDDLSTIRLDELLAAYVTTNGVWLIWSNRWRTMTIDPNDWSHSDMLRDRLEELIPSHLVVRERADATSARRERRAA